MFMNSLFFYKMCLISLFLIFLISASHLWGALHFFGEKYRAKVGRNTLHIDIP